LSDDGYDDGNGDDYGEERFRGKPKRGPRGRARMDALRDQSGPDAGLAKLRERGLVHEIVGELKSGKEADVVLARGEAGLIALKIHRDPSAGGFRPDAVYLEGRRMPRGRLRKVLDRGARAGLSADLALWVLHETKTLWELHRAGVPVPRPLLGPGAHEILDAGRIVPMAFIGDPDGTPAPRLADTQPTPKEAQDAWRQAKDAAAAMLRAGIVHGDLSAWNLLWHDGRIVVVDVPQAVTVQDSPHAAQLFTRDVRSLVDSVRPMGIDEDPDEVEAELRVRAGLPPRGPFPF